MCGKWSLYNPGRLIALFLSSCLLRKIVFFSSSSLSIWLNLFFPPQWFLNNDCTDRFFQSLTGLGSQKFTFSLHHLIFSIVFWTSVKVKEFSWTLITSECSIFVQRPPTPFAPPQPGALSFITCEGLLLSAAVALLFINHSQGSIKRWLMVDTALSSHSSDVGTCSRVRPGGAVRRRVDSWQVSALISAQLRSSQRLRIRLCGPNAHWAWRSESLLCRSWPCLIRSRM